MAGEVGSIQAIAENERVTERYVARIIRLAWLAPDIVRAIQRGDVSEDASLSRLQQGYSLRWDEQRSVLLGPGNSI